MQAVDGATNSFLAQGVSGVQTEVTFNSIQNGDVIASRADMVVNATPNSNLQVPAGYVAVDINGNPLSSIPVSANGQVVIEMKTGAGGFTSNQATVYPAIQAGNASGVGSNAASASIQGSVPSTPVVVLRKL
jgi:filamentous hemagglutinin